MSFEQMSEIIPEGSKGEAVVEYATPNEFEARMSLMRGIPLEAGRTLTRLFVDGQLMMSDGKHEQITNREFLTHAKGDVLIAGLGIGMVLPPVLKKACSVLVIEKSQDVIDLVYPAFRHHENLEVICADIFTWKPLPGSEWHCIWMDIWPEICEDNLKEMRILSRKFQKYRAPGGWMGQWMQKELQSRRRKRTRLIGGW